MGEVLSDARPPQNSFQGEGPFDLSRAKTSSPSTGKKPSNGVVLFFNSARSSPQSSRVSITSSKSVCGINCLETTDINAFTSVGGNRRSMI